MTGYSLKNKKEEENKESKTDFDLLNLVDLNYE